MGQARNGLVVGGGVTIASGKAEREAVLDLIDKHRTVESKGSKRRKTKIDGRTTRHPGYGVSQPCRKRIEKVFGWAKTSAGLGKTIFRGKQRVNASFTLALATYNLVRLPKLLAEMPP